MGNWLAKLARASGFEWQVLGAAAKICGYTPGALVVGQALGITQYQRKRVAVKMAVAGPQAANGASAENMPVGFCCCRHSGPE
ncbi:hypothetical protein GCM10027567_06380 [Spongiibacter taiwanensis]